jgi:hypothetical protein
MPDMRCTASSSVGVLRSRTYRQNPREGPVTTWMRRADSEMRNLAVRADHREWVAKDALDVLLTYGMIHGLTTTRVLYF